MRLDDLRLSDLLKFPPDGGVIRFADRRALIVDADALGTLRHELVDLLGFGAARAILTRMGFAHGWHTAGANRELPFTDPQDWRRAGGRFHRLQGQVDFRPVPPEDRDPLALAEALWPDSYEAEQHLQLLGRSTEPVCWTLCGFASGYLSRAFGSRDDPVFCLESRCVGKGDAVCRMVARRASEWGPEAAHLADALNHRHLDHVLDFAAEALRSTEAKLERSRRALARAVPDTDPSGCIAFSEPMKRALGLARQAAAVDVPVLIEGESGAGKERLARVVHDESPRAAGPFVPVNAGAIAGTLLESELFGHKRGAFTGADRDRVGLFEAASGGTLFLDEMGELPLDVQVKLLRVLQEGEVRRLGENVARSIDARIVAATNRDLEAAIAAGRFRDDLFYRLAVVRIRVAPLRERKDDILPLARHFLGLARERTRKRLHDIAPAAANRLLAYGWPGNVRELQNAILRAAVVAEHGTLEETDLPEELRGTAVPRRAAATAPGTFATLEEVERAHVERVLDAHEGHRAAAAKALGISPATLYRKLRRFHPK